MKHLFGKHRIWHPHIGAVSDDISNCNICKDERITVNNFDILKECRNKLETLISEAILIKKKQINYSYPCFNSL